MTFQVASDVTSCTSEVPGEYIADEAPVIPLLFLGSLLVMPR